MGKLFGAIGSLVVVTGLVLGLIALLGQIGYFDHPQAFASSATSSSSVKHANLVLETLPASAYDDPAQLNTFKSIVEKGDASSLGQAASSNAAFSPPGDHPNWVTYWPTTRLVVPAHALVTVSIYNWDSKSPLLNDYYSRPIGTTNSSGVVDNSEIVHNYDKHGQPVTTTYTAQHPVDPANVSHTFTLRSIPGSNAPYLFVSVPVFGVSSSAESDDAGFPKQPVISTFTFKTSGPGTYAWNCFDPCGNHYDSFGGAMQTFGYMSGQLVVQ